METNTDPELTAWLLENLGKEDATNGEAIDRRPGTWLEIRLFISSTFIDTHSERDILIKRVIPSLNRKLADKLIRVIPVDLRWGILSEDSSGPQAIQKTCLNQVDNCRSESAVTTPWFLGLRTKRYGWVQDEYMRSEGFERPKLYSWLDALSKTDRKLSITSLEVMHAAQLLDCSTVSPTVFFYNRNMIDEFLDEDGEKTPSIPENRKWIFDFEFVEEHLENPELKNQYKFDKNAYRYAKDRESLNEYLRKQKRLIFRDFDCVYDDCRITGEVPMPDGSKKYFGVGYTTGLLEFQKMTEDDLFYSITNNYITPAGLEDLFAFGKIQHENAIALKASTFVGRTAFVEKITTHCIDKGGPTLMILHGQPGCGKSGLVAIVAYNIMKKMDATKDFLFAHAVDTCPGSTLLEGMLRRINRELRKWRRKQKETNIREDNDCVFSDVRSQHMPFIIETAKAYPNSTFTFIIDAVNQFHHVHQAWDMWWLPGDGLPQNVKFLISTLTEENGTFDNAREVAPNAAIVEIDEMSEEDLTEMVTLSLGRFNKKLSTTDDGFLGNQMALLLSKSKSPLFLNAACEALRRFGIFEEVTAYIKKLPNNIRDLFKFLIQDWKTEYGENFVHDIMGIIAISKDGLLENQINDFMSFREEKLGTFYDANFSRIYDGLNSFLAAGGGGYLRFFHDQLKYCVREMLDDSFIRELHQLLSDFFYQSICTQFKCKPDCDEKTAYHYHSLNQIVYHRIQAGMCLKDTLRNIFFIRERIVAGQLQNLVNEYNEAIEKGDENESKYKEWLSFSQMYAHRITEFPELAYNMAVNQSRVSSIRRDVGEMYSNCDENGVLYWTNSPNKVDPMISKYPYGGHDIAGSKSMVAIAGETVVLLDLYSGEMIHKLVGLSAHSLFIDESTSDVKVYCGGSNGSVSRWDVGTGTQDWKVSPTNSALVWTYLTAKFLLVGEGHARKTICWNKHDALNSAFVLDRENGNILNTFSLGGPAFDYAYVEMESVEIILAAQKGDLSGWNLNTGERLFTVKTGHGAVYSVSAHPTLPRFIFGGNDFHVHEYEISSATHKAEKIEERSKILDTTSSGWFYGGNWSVSYDHTGDRVLTAEPQSKSVRIYSPTTGELLHEMRGHQDCVNKITLSGDGLHVVTTDRGNGSILYKLPDADIGEESAATNAVEIEQIKWAMFGKDGSKFYTVAEGKLRQYDSVTLEMLQVNDDTCTHYRCDGAISSDGSYLVVNTGRGMISFFNVDNLLEAFHEVNVLPDSDHSITAVSMSPDSTKLLITDCANHNSSSSVAVVLDIADVRNCKTPEIYRKVAGARVFSGAIHYDNDTAIYAGHGDATIFSISTKETLKTFRGACFFVRFMTNGHLLYRENEDLVRYDWKNDKQVMIYEAGNQVIAAILLTNEKEILLGTDDGMIKVYDTEGNGKAKYAFFSHQAQGYAYLHASPDEQTILAPDTSSQLYILKRLSDLTKVIQSPPELCEAQATPKKINETESAADIQEVVENHRNSLDLDEVAQTLAKGIESEPVPEPEPESVPQSVPQSEPVPESVPDPESEPMPGPVANPEPVPVSEPTPNTQQPTRQTEPQARRNEGSKSTKTSICVLL